MIENSNKIILNHGSLFSGIGGFDLASEWMGWNNVFHCEWNQFGQKILKHYWPKAITYNDITKTDFSIHRGTIDIITGGFPCQPYSLAGKRLGKEDKRHLWPEMLRAIQEIQPTWIVGENVSGLINWNAGMVFDEVQTDLEIEGYEVWPFVLPAASVNAPHRRDRVWFVAYSNRNGLYSSNSQHEVYTSQTRTDAFSDTFKGIDNGINSNSNRTRFKTFNDKIENLGKKSKIKEISREHFKRFYSAKGWENFPTQSPVCNGNDGISSRLDSITFSKWRTESIKAGGNAIVPQVALQIFKAINHFIMLNLDTESNITEDL